MNNPFQRTNDINSFRNSIAGSISDYDHKIALGNQRVLSAKSSAIRQAKDLKDEGDNLEKVGLEVTTSTHAARTTIKGIKGAYNKLVNAKQKFSEVKQRVNSIKDRFNQRNAAGETEEETKEDDTGVEMTDMANKDEDEDDGDEEVEISRDVPEDGGVEMTNMGAQEESSVSRATEPALGTMGYN